MKAKLIVISLSFLQLILAVSTYIIDQNKANWLCGPALMLILCILFLFQLTFLIAVLIGTTVLKSKIVISASVIFTLLSILGFLRFYFNCS